MFWCQQLLLQCCESLPRDTHSRIAGFPSQMIRQELLPVNCSFPSDLPHGVEGNDSCSVGGEVPSKDQFSFLAG